MSALRSESIDELFKAILNLENVDECYALFEDLCTIREMQDMAQRLQVARMLDEGKNYQEISKATSVSSATISRVNRCLMYGSGGYRQAVDRLKKKEGDNKK
ncbi:MAG: helix-turn-helix domain-containing protein [Dehalococcoidales bacterium]|jgi:TrpR-related protein YerC/YecD|nr:helix-turn-helix domain-containing protein [Dehalococcoidales bacterium]